MFKFPFGAESCEHELKIMRKRYSYFYYDQTRFTEEAIKPSVYLIVGRRGSGKTSLAKYFEFQSHIKGAHCIDVDEPETYDDVLKKLALTLSSGGSLRTSHVRKIWDYAIWSLIFNTYRDHSPAIAAASALATQNRPARVVADLLKSILAKLIGDSRGTVAGEVEDYLSSEVFQSARVDVLDLTRRSPIILAFDTLERYDRRDEALMACTAALVESASNFNISFADDGIHVKVFVSAEIFPYIRESAISNTTKHIRDVVYLHWRPKDLIRLMCWRLHRYLDDHPGQRPLVPLNGVNWADFDDVLHKVWNPYFGEKLSNANGHIENSFTYLLRHTQMRPRQLVVIGNSLAADAQKINVFPEMSNLPIPMRIRDIERDLATEVLNSYDLIYPRVAEIVDALRTSPQIFRGSYLDKVASSTAYAWPASTYSKDNFRSLVAELGIVGRVRTKDDKTGIITADFEYTLPERLALRNDDTCVIHPMFYSKLQTEMFDKKTLVYPFPDHEDFQDLRFR